MITPKEIHGLAELARIRLTEAEEKHLADDLEKILKYVEELKTVDTTAVKPMTGGTSMENVWRNDNGDRAPNERAIRDFPNAEENFLKVPPVFE